MRMGHYPGFCVLLLGMQATLMLPNFRRRLDAAHVPVTSEVATAAGVPEGYAMQVVEVSRRLQGKHLSHVYHHPLMLLRFLTAGHEPRTAAGRILSTQTWRKRVNLKALMQEWGQPGPAGSWQLQPKSPRAQMASRHLPVERWRWTANGCPVLLARIGAFDLAGMVREQMFELFMNHFVFLLEDVLQSVHAISVAQKILARGITIIDASGMSLWMAHYRNYAKPVIQMMNTHYPDMVKAIYVVNAPRTFVELWSLVSPLLNPNTRQKVQILSTDFDSHLAAAGIEVSHLPVYLGGKSTDSRLLQHMPVPDGASQGLNLSFGGTVT